MKHPVEQSIQFMENYMEKKDFYQAEIEAKQFLKRYPEHPFGYLVKGSLMLKIDQELPGKAAKDLLWRALFLCYSRPSFRKYIGIVYNELGIYYRKLGLYERALTCYYQSLEYLEPNEHRRQSLIHFNLATTYLTTGNLEQGFPEYKWVYIDRDDLYRYFKQPYWQGEAHPTKTLLIHNEQAYGDLIFFLRCLRAIKPYFKKIYLEVTPRLIRLVKSTPLLLTDPSDLNSPPDSQFEIVPRPGDRTANEQPNSRAMTPPHPPEVIFHYHTNYALLPYYAKISMETIPTPLPYLRAEPAYIKRWCQFLTPFKDHFKIGINWSGKPTNSKEHLRKIPLEKMLRLADIPGVQLFSLQKFVGLDQVHPGQPMINLDRILDRDLDHAFLDTAALMTQLDLVITSDTSTAHIAGCLNRPVWILLHKTSEWRWFLDRSDSPWYPEVCRLFRQQELGAWDPVIEEVHQALTERVSQADWVSSQETSLAATPQSFTHLFEGEQQRQQSNSQQQKLTSHASSSSSIDLDQQMLQVSNSLTQKNNISRRIPDINRILPDYRFTPDSPPAQRKMPASTNTTNIVPTNIPPVQTNTLDPPEGQVIVKLPTEEPALTLAPPTLALPTPAPPTLVSASANTIASQKLQPIRTPSGPRRKISARPLVPIQNPVWEGPYWETTQMIDPELLKQYQQIHYQGAYDGMPRHVEETTKLIKENQCQTFLDFGSGKGKQYYEDQIHKRNNWQVEITLYDPGVPGLDRLADRSYDFIFCAEVMEHLTEEILEPILDYLFGHVQKVLLITVALTEAIKTLPDGRNSHTLVKPRSWWQERFNQYQQKYRLTERGVLLRTIFTRPTFDGETIISRKKN